MFRRGLFSGLAAGFVLGIVWAQGGGVARADNASFTVTDRVIASPELPFTATIARIGNGYRSFFRNSGFEPVVFRTRMTARADAANEIILDSEDATAGEALAEGALDGADVRVYRVENGRFVLVRADRVAVGGHRATGWKPLLSTRRIAPSETSAEVVWPDQGRQGGTIHLSLRAIGAEGGLSAPSQPVTFQAANRDGSVRARNDYVRVRVREDAPTPAPPSGLRTVDVGGGKAILYWQAPRANLAGYRIDYSTEPPARHRGFGLDLAGSGPAILAGDLVIVSKRFLNGARAGLVSDRAWNSRDADWLTGRGLIDLYGDQDSSRSWHLEVHPLSPPWGGESYLSATLKEGASLRIDGASHAGTDQSFYEVLDPARTYVLEFWLRGTGGRVQVLGPAVVWAGGRAPVFEPGPDWQKVQAEFRMPSLARDGRIRQIGLRLDGPGQIDLDALQIRETSAPYLSATEKELERLRASRISALRTHAFIKTGTSTYDLAALTNPAGAIDGVRFGQTLPQTLDVMAVAGVDPWLQIEPHFAPEEWAGLVEFLAAPFDPDRDSAEDLPWAAKRVASGRARPWTDAFDRIYFELGNEMWNPLFAPWTTTAMTDASTGKRVSAGDTLGLWTEHALAAMRTSPHWPALEPKLVTVIGGRASRPEFGADAARSAPSSDLLAVAGYNGGWDEGEDVPRQNPRSYFNLLNQVTQVLPTIRSHAAIARDIGEARGRPLSVGTYEAGPGYVLNGLNRRRVSREQADEQEAVMKSVAAGTATLDSFLTRAAEGYAVQNFFTFEEGNLWKSHADWHEGGNALPSWAFLEVVNAFLPAQMLAVETEIVPRADLEEVRRRAAVKGAPLVAVHALRSGDRLALAVISRRVSAYPDPGDAVTSVRIALPFSRADTLTLHRYTDPFTMPADRNPIALSSEPVPVPATLPEFVIPDLPPGQARIYVFDGVSD